MSGFPLHRVKYNALVNSDAMGENTDPEFEFQYVDISNVDSKGKIVEMPLMTFANAPSRARRRVQQGDVIVSTVRTYLQAIAPIDFESQNVVVSTGFAVVRPLPSKLDVGFAKYAFRESQFLFEVMNRSVGVSYPAINSSELADIKIPTPPIEMQRRITVYLDRETSEIDRLITAKERLMTLLAEKRCGLLTHAVTRGFSNGPIKDSNFAWIGDIPSHWTIERLKSHIKSIVQGWSPQCDSFPANDDEWGVLKVGAVNGWMFDSSEQKRLPTDLDPILDYEVKPGDILMSRANTSELVGRVVIVEQVRPRLMFCDKHYRIEIDETRLDARFLFYFLRSPTGHFEFEVAASGASNSMQNISQEAVRNVWVTIPPIKEQVEIVKTVSDGFKRIEELEFRTLESIRLLHERRAALISAAVTGELEVL